MDPKELFGTEVAFDGMIGETRMKVKIRALICGHSDLPGNRYSDAVDGAHQFLRSLQDNRDTLGLPQLGPEQLQRVLREEHHGVRIMAKDLRDPKPPICWDPSKSTIEKF